MKRPLGPRDALLIYRVAEALAEFYDKPLTTEHFNQARKLLYREGGPLQNFIDKLGPKSTDRIAYVER